jgi:uncharacterized protein
MSEGVQPDDADAATATLVQARDHARSQADAASGPRAGSPGSGVLWDEVVPGGGYATHRLGRDAVLTLTDVAGDTCVALVVHRADATAERLNVADTVKVQWQAYPGAGSLLLSDMGRVLMTVTADTSAGHDALCGCTNRRSEAARSGGEAGPWSTTPNARDLLLLGLAKHGLTRRDLPPCLDLFRGVRVAEDGSLELKPPGAPGAAVELRAEVDVIVTLAVVRHPLDPRPGSTAGDVHVRAVAGARPDPDPFRDSTPERRRAFENTDESLAGGLR